MANDSKIIEFYCEIIDGFSPFFVRGKVYYFKHPTFAEITKASKMGQIFIEEAVKNGIDKLEDRIKFIISQGWWSQEQEDAIVSLRKEVEQLKGQRRISPFASQRKVIDFKIDKLIKSLAEKLTERRQMMAGSDIAEDIANKKIWNYFLLNNVYQDCNLTDKAFTKEEYDILSDDITFEYQTAYADTESRFNSFEIKKVAASMFFLNLLGAAETTNDFFGKPIIKLTKYQTDLFCTGKGYLAYVRNNDISNLGEEIIYDPVKFIEIMENKSDAAAKLKEKLHAKDDNVRATYVFGAKKGDLKDLGIHKTGNADLFKEAEAHGGTLEKAAAVKLSES